VGVGNGEVESRILASVPDVTLVDVAPESLMAASARLSRARTEVMAAERLHSLDTGKFDLYVSFRAYQSTFFDLRPALREAHRLLRPGGSAVITVANGFVRDGSVVRGLVVPGTAYVDLDRPYELANAIRHHMAVLGFREPSIRSGADEIFVYGSRGLG
jgi:SAM-dependent methyltransferase